MSADAAAPASAASGATVRLRLPHAGPSIRTMLTIYLLLLFLVPGSLLDLVGYDYSSLEGSPLTKIHVATYFIVVVFFAFVISYPRRDDLVRYYLATKLGTIYLLCAITFALINVVFGGRNGFGMLLDTDLPLCLCCMLLPFAAPRDMERLERFVHWFFAANAVLGIAELYFGAPLFPLITYSPDGITTLETRATAFLSHPLHAATLTCAYIVSLLTGAGRLLRPALRLPMIGLQTMALLAFGGRTALLLTLAIIALLVTCQVLGFLGGKHLSRIRLIVAVSSVPVGISLVAMLAHAGLFDPFLERFSDDGGSARSRALMLPLLLSFNWADFLWGATTDAVRAQVYSFGLEWGVENPLW
jgi:hypothetical protein